MNGRKSAGGSGGGSSDSSGGRQQRVVTLAVVGLSGTDKQKGVTGVGKSTFCNRLVRPHFNDFFHEHLSFISQSDFTSPIINREHWLFHGELALDPTDHLGPTSRIRVIEHTTLLDDESFEPLGDTSAALDYQTRALQLHLQSNDRKLAYICPDQLGAEADYVQIELEGGRCEVDAFAVLFDVSNVPERSLAAQSAAVRKLTTAALETKRPVFLLASKPEVSALENVNVAEFCYLLAQVIDKPKSKAARLPSFVDAQRMRNHRTGFKALLEDILPQEEYPLRHNHLTWPVLLEEFSINQHPTFAAFVSEFGCATAKRVYDEHMRATREHWLDLELTQALPLLSETFKRMFSPQFLCQIASPPKLEVDNRIPSEVLQKPEARVVFNNFQKEIIDQIALERQVDKFKRLLEKKEAVTPGRSFADVKIMLGEEIAEYEQALPSDYARYIYENHQKELKKKAERDFCELLLGERQPNAHNPNRVGALSEREFNIICSSLIEDRRFRHMSGLSSRRRDLISKTASFMAMPLTCFCPAGDRCSDLLVSNIVADRRRDTNKFSTVDADVFGTIEIVDEFIAAVKLTLPSDRVFQHNDKIVKINCERAVNAANDYGKKRGSRRPPSASSRPKIRSPPGPSPIFVGVPARNARENAAIQQAGRRLADRFGGVFVAIEEEAGSLGSLVNAPPNKISAHFTTNCNKRCTNWRPDSAGTTYADLRVRFSFLCDDPLSISQLLAPLLEHSSQTDDTGGNFCVDAINLRVCCTPTSYHSWLMSKWTLSSFHSHVLVFTPARLSSFRHMETALNLLLDAATVAGPASSSVLERQAMARSILLVAFEDPAQFFSENDSNHLLSEAAKMAERVGCKFVAVSSSMPQTAQFNFYTDWFGSLLHNLPQPNESYTVCSQNPRSTYSANVTSFTGSASTLLSSSPSDSRESNLAESGTSSACGTSAFGLAASSARNQPPHHASNRPPSRQEHEHVIERRPLDSPRPDEKPTAASIRPDRPTPSGSLRSNQSLTFAQPSNRRPLLVDSSLNVSVHGPNGPHSANKTPEMSNRFRRPLSAIGSLMSGNGFSAQPSPDGFLQTSTEETSNNNISPNDGHSNKIKFSPSGFRKLFQRSNAGSESSVEEQSRKKLHRSSTVDAGSAIKRRSVHEKLPEVIPASPSTGFVTYVRVEDSPPRSPTKKAAKKPLRAVLKSLSVDSVDGDRGNAVAPLHAEPTANGVRFAPDIENIPTTTGVLDLSAASAADHFERPSRLRRFADRLTRRHRNQPPRRQSLPPKKLDCTNLSSPTSAGSNSPLEMTYESECKNGDEIPSFVRACIEYIQRNNGLVTEGLYRLNGHPTAVAELEKQFRKTGTISPCNIGEDDSRESAVISVSAALKRYLGSFPEPIIPERLNDEILAIFNERSDIDDKSPLSTRALDSLRRLFARELPRVNARLLSYVCSHLERVAQNHERNRMTAKNLALIWAATVFRLPTSTGMAEASALMTRFPIAFYFFIKHHSILF
ncbi:hypothetical protein M3Y99_01692300 [Aphelenchoides fujianensis]|nr:hypothetical protein M3Y99_01692300 [Aphelenchoides fujianensis]